MMGRSGSPPLRGNVDTPASGVACAPDTSTAAVGDGRAAAAVAAGAGVVWLGGVADVVAGVATSWPRGTFAIGLPPVMPCCCTPVLAGTAAGFGVAPGPGVAAGFAAAQSASELAW